MKNTCGSCKHRNEKTNRCGRHGEYITGKTAWCTTKEVQKPEKESK